MNRTPEQLANAWLKQKLPENYHVQRIETSTGSGVPDINMIVDGREVWMEVKANQKTKAGYVRIRKEQYAWMKRRAMCGGVCVVVDREQEGKLTPSWSLWGIRRDTPVVPSSDGYVVIPKESEFDVTGAEHFEEALELLINRAQNQ